MLLLFTIPGRLPTLNEEIKALKSHWSKYSTKKKLTQNYIGLIIKSAKVDRLKSPVGFVFVWKRKNIMSDLDNLSFGTKYILDALVAQHIIEDDRVSHIPEILHRFEKNEAEAIDVYWYGLKVDKRKKGYNYHRLLMNSIR